MHFEEILMEKEPVIRVIGVGGAGGTAINNMKKMGIGEMTTIAVDTDKEALDDIRCDFKILMKKHGSDKELKTGRKVVMESEGMIKNSLGKADIVFVVAGMGGQTGAISPLISRIPREIGALIVAIVTMPFSFEGEICLERAKNGLSELKGTSGCIFPIFNDRLCKFYNPDDALTEIFEKNNEFMCRIVRSISGLLHENGLISIDFADVKSIIKKSGFSKFGTGMGRGVDKARNAAMEAINCPMFENFSLKEAGIVLVNIMTGKDSDIAEVAEAMQVIYENAGGDQDISYAHVFDKNMEDEIRVNLFLAGFHEF